MDAMATLKIICGLVCFLVLGVEVWSMLHWNEARAVYDDVCYLRQAHLFQRFGLAGLDTDISHDDDGFLSAKLKKIGFPPNDPPPCHTRMPATGKLVIQSPPGTGMVLGLFPQGHQMVPLFVSATIIVFGFALLGIFYARSTATLVPATALGCLAVYIMVNPVKASYSMAPTMAMCALAGFLTAKLFAGSEQRRRIWLTVLLGLLLGFAVNLRLPNLFLSAGYFLFFLVSFLSSRKLGIAARGISFGAAFFVGMAPTLLANAINAGSPFATTYGGVASPDFSIAIVRQYLGDTQFVLLALAGASIAAILLTRSESGVRRVALVSAVNLVVNLAFFLSHPLFTPYYTIPIAMLSLWSLSFAAVIGPLELVDENLAGQTANARS
jgi:hypothetical protein